MALPNPMTLLASTAIGASGVGSAVNGFALYGGVLIGANLSAVPTGGAPTLDFYIQCTPDGGTTWQDIAHYQFTTSSGWRFFPISQFAAGPTGSIAASDAALSGDTIKQGPFGDQLRVKYVFAAGGSSGTYTLAVSAQPVGAP